MAKKRSINKSEQIRNYKKKHPSAKPGAIAEALTAETGVEFSANSVSSVLYQQKSKKSSGRKQSGAKKTGKRKSAMTSSNANGSAAGVLAAIDAATDLIEAAGSVDAAKEILDKIGSARS